MPPPESSAQAGPSESAGISAPTGRSESAETADSSGRISPETADSSGRISPEAADSSGQVAEQLLRLTRRLHHAQKAAFRPLGLTPAQSRLLRTVGAHSRRGAAPRMADLARHLEVVPRAVTTLVDALEELGAVRRAQDPDNRRVVLIELTDEGRTMLRKLRQARQSAAEDILKPLTDEQRGQLGGLLSTLVDGPENGC